ncbi:hypothetical protein Pyn_14680 [Prunus yedoensis var. nudiflora]|uniref:Uncharacterized protein n=1 Tax=Prunus yedoensis var. nudiflora TaxID=2094558 RepID=A0A314ZJM8_PRUYE|nr:hypothetical protein Pyn_14680 [Prunus yedoensis var. nudiflora]
MADRAALINDAADDRRRYGMGGGDLREVVRESWDYNLGIGAVWELSSGVSSSWRCSSEAEEKEYGLRIWGQIGERRCRKCSFDFVKAIAEFQSS